jgi:NTE family protein
MRRPRFCTPSPLLLLAALLLAGCATPAPTPPVELPAQLPIPPVTPARAPAKIALVLGGGAARGFAHIGVIKALEAQGIVPDIIVGTSAGSVVGALYAAGYSGFDMQAVSLQMDEGQVSDWSVPNRGVIKGEALQDFINNAVKQRPLEKLDRLLAVVATDLKTGEMIVFRTGNTGMAVRASSSVPGVFQPVSISGHDYVDGGLVAPVAINVARSLGADFVIAVDISDRPQNRKTDSTFEILMQTFTIMEQTINRAELPNADIVIRPDTQAMDVTDFNTRNLAVLEGEKAAAAAMPELKAKLAKLNKGRAAVTKK